MMACSDIACNNNFSYVKVNRTVNKNKITKQSILEYNKLTLLVTLELNWTKFSVSSMQRVKFKDLLSLPELQDIARGIQHTSPEEWVRTKNITFVWQHFSFFSPRAKGNKIRMGAFCKGSKKCCQKLWVVLPYYSFRSLTAGRSAQ